MNLQFGLEFLIQYILLVFVQLSHFPHTFEIISKVFETFIQLSYPSIIHINLKRDVSYVDTIAHTYCYRY